MKTVKKVILSTFGPLHLIKSSEYIAKYVDITVIQGWIPTKFNFFLLKIASKIVGRDLTKTIQKRTPKILDGRNISIGFPEFYLWFRRYFFQFNLLDIPKQSAVLYGRLSCAYLKDAEIFHVRSGSGAGGSIEKAKANKMKVLVDHSIAHPKFMDLQLKEEFEKNDELFDLGSETPFWKLILDDCDKADILLVNSEFVKNTFKQFNYPTDKIEVIYLGVREDFFSLKKSYEAKNDCFRILFTGSFGFRKGGEYLLQSLIELDKINFDYEMIIVGSYDKNSNLLKKYKPKNIKFIGHIPQEDLKSYLANSDVYLFPSLCEGCASSGMEALAAGLPVVATYESGLPIAHMENGVIIQSKNALSIKDAILFLSNDIKVRKEIGINAAKLIKDNYTWEMYARNICMLYNKLVE